MRKKKWKWVSAVQGIMGMVQEHEVEAHQGGDSVNFYFAMKIRPKVYTQVYCPKMDLYCTILIQFQKFWPESTPKSKNLLCHMHKLVGGLL